MFFINFAKVSNTFGFFKQFVLIYKLPGRFWQNPSQQLETSSFYVLLKVWIKTLEHPF